MDWLVRTVLPAVGVAAVLLLALWPTARSGRRLLRTWGIPRPRPDQVDVAVGYLRQRRILYVAGFLLLPPLVGLVLRPEAPGVRLFVPLLVAMLVAETVATLRPAGGVRVARLDRRGWQDLVPRWAVVVLAAMALLTAGLAGYGLTQARGPETVEQTSGAALVYLVVCLAMVGLLVHLAVRRPSVLDEAVDAALRRRTARVAVGIGFGWVGTALNVASQRIHTLQVTGPERPDPDWFGDIMSFAGLGVLGVSIGCWLWVALPSRRSLAPR
jgi:hypothetical protein